ncbi:MAG: HDOD domain-containing protein [Nitrospiraceae bacterium]|nr:HDOD domain-containing protein [Nitrospiraceae bacterium]
MPSAQELVESCDCLVSLPEIYLRVREVVDNPDSSMNDLAKVLALDPAITARILQVVNSPLYGLPKKIGTLSQAVGLLGMQPIQDIVFATSVAKAFPRIEASVMDVTAYWRKSVRCGLLATSLGKLARLEDPEGLFVIGLLRDVGHLVMYQTVPARAQSALVEAGHLSQSIAEVEQSNIGCDYTEVGGELLKKWGMPASIESAIRHQLTPSEAGEHEGIAGVIGVSGALSDYLENLPADKEVDQDVIQATVAPIRLTLGQASGAIEAVHSQLRDVLNLIYPKAMAMAA